MAAIQQHKISLLGDSAVTVDFGNVTCHDTHKRVLTIFRSIKKDPLPGMTEVVPAYSSLTVYYDLFQLRSSVAQNTTVADWMMTQLEERVITAVNTEDVPFTTRDIPVCYDKEFAPHLEEIASLKKISVDDVIQLHVSTTYLVYMLGFLPGFAYMGEVDEKIAVPRRPSPSTVAAGSVGIAGRQTGIYPFVSPGGWQIIGRTPLKLFDANSEELTLLKAGDNIRFYSISRHEFENF
ncbi:MAG TPA: 5-oxoprolinase subunit PxpB [Chitinophagaceae bacterium]|nr:5-oxoprolinase subunit PxpB [Chitinophagaceae bacterium]